MTDKFPFVLGKIIIHRFDQRVNRYVGKCSCGEKITLSKYEVKHSKILQCAKCAGMDMNMDDTDKEPHTLLESGGSRYTAASWVDPLINRKFGFLTVTGIAPKSATQYHRRLELLCSRCNKTTLLTRQGISLRYKARGEEADCGCGKDTAPALQKPIKAPIDLPELSIRIKKNEDLTGLRLGYLKVIRQTPAAKAKRAGISGRAWECQCALCKSPAIYILSTTQLTARIRQANHCPHCEHTNKRKKPLKAEKLPLVLAKKEALAAAPKKRGRPVGSKNKAIKTTSKVKRTTAPVKIRSGVIG